MNSICRIFETALGELADAVRSRRAMVVLLLYLVSAVCCMYGTISIFSKMESELVKVLQLPEAERTGDVSETLWKSKSFQHIVKGVVANDLVYHDIKKRHPVELVYAWFVFLFSPFLVVLVAGNRVADELSSGSVRYSLIRCARFEWTCGKFAGQALLLAVALAVSAVGAWIVAVCRLSSAGALLPAMFSWSLRAWILSFAWLGVVMGLSHITRSAGRATGYALFAVVALMILPGVLKLNADWLDLPWLENLDVLSPSSATSLLWRNSSQAALDAVFRLFMLAFFYLMCGFAIFSRRDA